VSFDAAPSSFLPPPLQLNWSGLDLDLWPRPSHLTSDLKTSPTMTTHMTNICDEFHWIPPLCKEISCQANGWSTDGRTTWKQYASAANWRRHKYHSRIKTERYAVATSSKRL